jgi:aerobic-type carbon monoxide dehydrogenase small subunit (CoxS/CutS family)
MAFTLLVNGSERSVDVSPEASLLDVLRNCLHLTGTKYGCGEGQCGACSVLVEGSVVRSCRIAVSSVEGKKITTIEGLSGGERLHPVQQAFLEVEAFQCGYCTPGMIVAAVALLARSPRPTEEEIARQLQGSVCRCGCYPRILEAVQQAARAGRGETNV